MIAANCSAKADFGYNPFRLLFRVIRLISCQFVVAKPEARTTKYTDQNTKIHETMRSSGDDPDPGSAQFQKMIDADFAFIVR